MISKNEEETRRIMKNAAIRLAAESGFEAFTIRRWAMEAEVSQGSLYRYFKNKNELLTECFLMIARELEEAGVVQPELSSEEPDEGLPCGQTPGPYEKAVCYFLTRPDRLEFYMQFRFSPRSSRGVLRAFSGESGSEDADRDERTEFIRLTDAAASAAYRRLRRF